MDDTGILDERYVERSTSQTSHVSHVPPFTSSSHGATSSHPTSFTTTPPLPFYPSQIDCHTLAMFQHFQGHVDERLNEMDTWLVEIQNLVRQMARTSFTPGGCASGNSFEGDTHCNNPTPKIYIRFLKRT